MIKWVDVPLSLAFNIAKNLTPPQTLHDTHELFLITSFTTKKKEVYKLYYTDDPSKTTKHTKKAMKQSTKFISRLTSSNDPIGLLSSTNASRVKRNSQPLFLSVKLDTYDTIMSAKDDDKEFKDEFWDLNVKNPFNKELRRQADKKDKIRAEKSVHFDALRKKAKTIDKRNKLKAKKRRHKEERKHSRLVKAVGHIDDSIVGMERKAMVKAKQAERKALKASKFEEKTQETKAVNISHASHTKAEKHAHRMNMLAKKRDKREKRRQKRVAFKQNAGHTAKNDSIVAQSGVYPVAEAGEFGGIYIFFGDYTHHLGVVLDEYCEEAHCIVEPFNGHDRYYHNGKLVGIFLYEALSPGDIHISTESGEFDLFSDYKGLMASTVTYMVQLYRSSSHADRILASIQFCYILELNDIIDSKTLSNQFIENFSFAFDAWSMPSTESGVIDDMSTFLNSMLSGDLVFGLRSFLMTLAGAKIFGKPFNKCVYDTFGEYKHLSVVEFLQHLLESLKTLVRFGSAVMSGVPIVDAMFAKDPIASACDVVTDYLTYADRTYDGMPAPGYVDVREFMTTLKNNVIFLEKSLSGLSPLSPYKRRAQRLIADANYQLGVKESEVKGGTRNPPFAIVVCGDSGMGKGFLIPYFASINDDVRGRKFKRAHIFPRSATSQYWEGYNPWSQPVIHFSEVGRYSDSQTNMRGDTQLDEIVSLIDTNTFYPDMAFADKGKICAHPELVICDTNNPELHAQKLYKCPVAYLRRFLFITPIVLPQYRKEGSNAIDPAKSMSGDGHILDRYSFTVHIYKAGSISDKPIKVMLKSGIRLPELSSFLRDSIREHMLENSSVTELVENAGIIYEEKDEPTVPVKEGVLVLESGDYSWPVLGLYALTFWHLLYFLYDYLSKMYVKALLTEKATTWEMNPARLSLYLFCCIFLDLPKYYIVLFVLNWRHLLDKKINSSIERATHALETKMHSSLGSMKHYITGSIYRPFDVSTKLYKTICVAATFVAGIAAYKTGKGIYAWLFGGVTGSQSAFFDDDERYNLGASVERVEIKTKSTVWNERYDLDSRVSYRPRHTGTLRSLAGAVDTNVRFCKLVFETGIPGKTYALGVKGNCFLISKHALRGADKVTICISRVKGCHEYDSGWYTEEYVKSDFVEVNSDTLMFSIMADRARDITMHFHDLDLDSSFSGLFCNIDTRVKYINKPLVVADHYQHSITIDSHLSYSFADHRRGLCGLPVIAEFGKGCCIAGIHVAGQEQSAESFGTRLYQKHILSAIAKIEADLLFPVSSQSGEMKEDEVIYEPFEDVVLVSPNHKSVFRYEYCPGIQYFGTIEGPVILPSRSSLKRTKIGEAIASYFVDVHGVYDYVPTGRPMMRPTTNRHGEYISPYNNFIKKVANTKKTLDKRILMRIAQMITDRVITMLEARGYTTLSPLTLTEAINGVEGDPFIRRINPRTSGGHGWPGPKDKYIPLVDEYQRMPVEKLEKTIEGMINRYALGMSCHPVYRGNLKDEARSVQKCRTGKTRVFCGSSLDHLLVQRMFLSPFYSLLVSDGDIFGSAVGINIHSQADEFFNTMVDFSDDFIEGDYGGYDTSMPHGCGECVSSVIYEVLKHFGYTEDALVVVRGILTDNLYPYVVILNDLFCIPGYQPSGKYATAEDNCLRNLVLQMYAWEYEFSDVGYYFDYNMTKSYGDDLLIACKYKGFNNFYYAQFCVDHFGMEFTATDKGEISKAYLKPHEITFIKRSFKYDENFGRVVAPLPADTFIKSLTWTLPSNVISESEQLLQACASMVWEYAYYDSARFYEFRELVMSQLMIHYHFGEIELTEKLPTLGHVIAQTTGSADTDCPDLPMDDGDEPDIINRSSTVSTESGGEGVTFGVQVDATSFLEFLQPARTTNPNDLKLDIEEESTVSEYMRLRENVTSHPFYSIVFHTEGKLRNKLRDNSLRIPPGYKRMVQRLYDLKSTLQTTDDLPIYGIRTESGEMNSGQVSSTVESTMENFRDIDGEEQKNVSSGDSVYPSIGQDTQLLMDNFFKRPIEIATSSLTLGTDIDLLYNVWDLWSINPTVRSKLRNFAFFSGDLHLKIVVSGMPFHYGYLLFSPQPYGPFNEPLIRLNAATLSFSGMRPLLLNYLSQAPGAVTVDVRSNKPVVIKVPFISPKPMFRLYNGSTAISDVTSYVDFENACDLVIRSVNQIQSTSATPSAPRLQIYAWVENVKLGTTTGTHLAITTESGSYDEREQGPVEKVASNAAMISRALTKVPFIGSLAKASDIVFSGLTEIASLFGWSRPSIIEEATLVKNQTFQNGAQTIVSDTSKRITFDPKQELTVDPRIVGVDKDDLVIADIANRYTYLTSFAWNDTAVPMEVVWKCKNTPYLATYDSSLVNTYIQPTAAMFAALPFSYWNGICEYRLEIACSNFHRGKLGIMFEPNVLQSVLIEGDLSTNKQFLMIVDIQETQVIEFCVNWAYPRYWANLNPSVEYTQNYGTDFVANSAKECNGYIMVFPFTSLQSNDNSDISVNVYTRVKNLRVNQMSEYALPTERVIRSESGDYSVAESEPVTCFELNTGAVALDNCSLHHFGEEPLSFRSCLKRYVTTADFAITGATVVDDHLHIIDRNNPVNVLPFGATAVDPRWNMFSYLKYAFLAARGSFKKRVQISGSLDMGQSKQVKASLNVVSTVETTGISVVAGPPNSSLEGTVTFVPGTNAGIEYEVPYYSSNLFWFAFASTMDAGTNSEEYVQYWNKVAFIDIAIDGTYTDGTVSIDTAAGEDFTFMRFQGAPYFTVPI